MASLHIAVFFCDATLTHRLLDAGHNVNTVDNMAQPPLQGTPLHVAARHGYTGLVQILISSGAQVDQTTAQGETALHAVILALAVAKMPNHEKFFWHYDPGPAGRLAAIKMLLEAGANINAVDEKGQTPILVSICLGLEEVFHLLLAAGADLGMADAEGTTVLHAAVLCSNYQILSTLLRALKPRGIDLETTDSIGETALHKAAIMGDEMSAGMLLDHGASVDSKDAVFATPLVEAIANRHDSMVQLLLSYGSDLSVAYNFRFFHKPETGESPGRPILYYLGDAHTGVAKDVMASDKMLVDAVEIVDENGLGLLESLANRMPKPRGHLGERL